MTPRQVGLAAAAAALFLLAGPAAAAIHTFQQGLNGYTGAADTQVRGADPDFAHGSEIEIGVDAFDGGMPTQALLRFDGIFGAGAGQIPAGQVITNATLTLNVTSAGSGIRFHELLQPLNFATVTWTSAVGGLQNDGVEATQMPFTAVGANDSGRNIEEGLLVVDVTLGVQRMYSGLAAGHGWALLPFMPDGTNGIDFFSAESDFIADRPLLTVMTAPIPEPGTWALMLGGVALLGAATRARRG
jgi:hypothetical protein